MSPRANNLPESTDGEHMRHPDIASVPDNKTTQDHATAHTSESGASTSYIDQLFDTIRTRLLDEFPGAEENKTMHYTGFRYPGGRYFCMVTHQKTRIWFGYTGKHAELNLEIDGFVQYGKKLGGTKFNSEIRNLDDIEKAITVLKRLYDTRHNVDRKQPPSTTPAPHYNANNLYMNQMFDTLRTRLLDEFPGAEENKITHYSGFRYPGGAYFCTITKQKHKILFGYTGMYAALNMEIDGFVQCGKKVGNTKFYSEIRNLDEIEKAITVLKRLHDMWASGDNKQPPGTTPAPYYSANNLHVNQLFDTLRTRLLDEFPGAEENKSTQYNGFRYPGGAYLCTITLKRSKIWLGYSSKHATLNLKPDGFVQSVGRWSGAKYHSDIRNRDDIEKALVILKKLYNMGLVVDHNQSTGTMLNLFYNDNTEYLEQLYDFIRTRLLDEFPGAEENKAKLHSGFRYPNGKYFCTVARQKFKILFGYSGKHATLNLKPDGFVQYLKISSGDNYYSEIRKKEDLEKALVILKKLHGIGSDGDRKQPPGTVPIPYKNASILQRDQLYDTIRVKLLDVFPGAEENKTKYYNGFRYPNGKYFCTVAKQKLNISFTYSSKRAESNLKPDGFVQEASKGAKDKYHSEIKNMDDFEKAVSILKRLYGIGPDGDHKQPSGVAFDPDYTEKILHMDQLYDTIRVKLLDEFPGAEENKTKYYSGFRYPGEPYFCTVTKQKSKILFVYLGKRAVSKLNPDAFIKIGRGYGPSRYQSDIRSEDDFEKALSILKRLSGVGFDPDYTEKILHLDQLYDIICARLLETFPGAKENKIMLYSGFRYPGEPYFCTVTKRKFRILFAYVGKRAVSKLNPDAFIKVGGGRGPIIYRSDIRSEDDFEKALSILKRLRGIGPDGDHKQLSGVAFDPDYTEKILHLDQLYDTICTRLLETFPGAKESTIMLYSGFRYPGEPYFCTVTKQKYKILFAYLDRRAVSKLNPDAFIKVERGRGPSRYYSDIRSEDDFEKALSILMQISTSDIE